MAETTFEQLLEVALRLHPEQKAALVKALQAEPLPQGGPARAQIIAETEALRAAGAFKQVRSLRNQYPAPSLKRVSDRQLLAAIREAASEWETDLEDLTGHAD